MSRDRRVRRRMEEELRHHAEHLEELVETRTAELRASESKYRSLAENAPDIIQRFDRELRRLYANPAFERATGLSCREAVGRTDREMALPPDLIPFWEQAAQAVFQTGQSRIIAFEMPTPQGSRHYEAHLVPEFAPDGSVEHLLVITRDITERKRAEEALRDKEYLLSESQRIGHIGTWSVDLVAHVATWTRETYRLFGVAPETFTPSADALVGLLHPDDRSAMREWMRAALAGEHPGALEFRVPLPDGTVRVLVGRGEALFDDAGRPVRLVGTVQDVTDRKQAEEALRRLNEQLELQVAQRTEDLRQTVGRLQQLTLELSQAEDRERQRIADILHDDVQQTLAAAKFHLNLLVREARSAEESRRTVEQVKQMLREAIEKSRSLAHELSPALYQADLTETLKWLAQHMGRKHGLTVRLETRARVDSPAEPLKAFLYKVAQELLFNVAKHAGVREACLRVRRRGSFLYLSVTDRGRGFDPEKLAGPAGSGLLNIRERVQLLGGRMRIRSTPGRGSRFLIAIPDQSASPGAMPAECADGWLAPQTHAHELLTP
jgi:PAS domain S-box-containing protein